MCLHAWQYRMNCEDNLGLTQELTPEDRHKVLVEMMGCPNRFGLSLAKVDQLIAAEENASRRDDMLSIVLERMDL